MNNENFDTVKFLYKNFTYPFPVLKNPQADYLQEITDEQWIDGEYFWIYKNNPELRKKYKKTKTAHITACFFPIASLERLKPMGKLMLWAFYNDDLYEQIEAEYLGDVRTQSTAILNGEMEVSASTIPLGGMLASLRQELLQFVPETSVFRLSQMVDRYFSGLEAELKYKKNEQFPTISECIALREKSVCLYPFMQLIEVEAGIVLPPEVHEHPVIQRLQALICQMTVYFNEIQSLRKDEATGCIYYNMVKVIQNEYKMTLEEACLESLRLHNEGLEEFISLQNSLPDFGMWNDAVVNWVHSMSLFLSGWKTISANLDRYNGTAFPSALELQKKLSEI
ncbi:terpene synthase family protein [Chryseobacterium sp. WG14]|uniref:terpene synthase family protein n=1 Tax=Chryseobacterium sp. WG14 TaxID=2926909 RepID=UPI00211E86BC|nr:terpene synthase family protein [Chryseobacterium sp. WG14]MCQ9640813.1 terpene synthase family protein [Chryseobacterium sp. WG14]